LTPILTRADVADIAADVEEQRRYKEAFNAAR
jgi:hypothetical protein